MTAFDTAAELAARDVGEFLRRFTRAWNLPAESKGLPRDGAVPAALREAYAIGDLLDPRALEVQGEVLVFHYADPMITETRWGIPLDTVDQADPPVVIDTGGGWQPYLDRVSLACVDVALTAVIQEHDEELCNACELPAELVGPALAAFDRVPLPDLPMWIDVEESPVRWWSRPGQLLRTHGEGGVWLWASAQTRADLDAMYAALPGADWCN
ncbi:hypothetical protein BJY16_006521 [Actinoplanes octamycinicus]|uniref:Uncharacterized protein n=1 Tax=Actinoplanes octamycinicus TaxID=135948 RepID=A0A7W7H3P0_9ACTN|nr:SMI1/KNR4 family protein [Actinoplanes octamycinicus]MBB4743062.1 hypothetical protein [Actinoplanes octamycinicus]GIE61374.1 hypothetical protein Aoc01nite_67760 [Actinoplanes octamycinicus]